MHCLMSGRREEQYIRLFRNIFIYVDFENVKFFFCDFEKALQNAIKKCFPEAEIIGCYFHFTQALYRKLEKLEIKKEPFLHLKLIFYNFPFIKQESQLLIMDIIKNIDPKVDEFINYYKDNWLSNIYIKYKDFQIKTNNSCEAFHSELNNLLGKNVPSMITLKECLFELFKKKMDTLSSEVKSDEPIKSKSGYFLQDINSMLQNVDSLLKLYNSKKKIEDFTLKIKEID